MEYGGHSEFYADNSHNFSVFHSFWEKSLEIAKQHNDTSKIMIEEAKLAAVEEIKLKFDKLF